MGVLGSNQRIRIGTTVTRILPANETRVGMLLLADSANGGTIFIGFSDPLVTSTGDKAGIPLAANAQFAEAPPEAFTGEVWAIADAAAQVLIIREDVEPAGAVIP